MDIKRKINYMNVCKMKMSKGDKLDSVTILADHELSDEEHREISSIFDIDILHDLFVEKGYEFIGYNFTTVY